MRLPKSVQEIADVIGRERALYLIGQLPRCIAGAPGKQSSRVILYVPTLSRMSLAHELVRILGYNDAVKMCRHFGGEILQPANCSEIYKNYRDKTIDSMLSNGMTAAQIAAIMCLNVQYVRELARGMKKPQEELPIAANDNAPIERKARAANGQPGRLRR